MNTNKLKKLLKMYPDQLAQDPRVLERMSRGECRRLCNLLIAWGFYNLYAIVIRPRELFPRYRGCGRLTLKCLDYMLDSLGLSFGMSIPENVRKAFEPKPRKLSGSEEYSRRVIQSGAHFGGH